MHPDELKSNSHVVTGIEVCGPDENNLIPLPPIYAIDEIHALKEDIVRNDDVEK